MPEFTVQGQGSALLSLRDMLSHRSGFGDSAFLDIIGAINYKFNNMTRAELIRRAKFLVPGTPIR